MTLNQAIIEMQKLIKGWEQKGKIIEDRFGSLSPAQVQVTTAAIEACVDDLKTLMGEMEAQQREANNQAKGHYDDRGRVQGDAERNG